MQVTKSTGKDILRTLTFVYPDWINHGLNVIKSREVQGDLILWLISRRPGLEQELVPPHLCNEYTVWIWEAFRDDHPGRLYEMYSTAIWQAMQEDLYDELMENYRDSEANNGTTH